MPPIEFTFFSVTLFLALVALLEWKRRRMLARERMSRGLKGYVSNRTDTLENGDTCESDQDSLVVVQ
jgi:hypothetical protein